MSLELGSVENETSELELVSGAIESVGIVTGLELAKIKISVTGSVDSVSLDPDLAAALFLVGSGSVKVVSDDVDSEPKFEL